MIDILPPYVVINDSQNSDKAVLTQPAQEVAFPLGKEDKKIIDLLVKKFRQEENCAGLAAPQIGFSKRIIVFAVPEDPELKACRPDLTQTFVETLWINPSYQGIEPERHLDTEACFSVHKTAGEVNRFKKIFYQAYTFEGIKVEGIAEGFSARVIQHEIDHINGILYVDRVPKDQLMSKEEYLKRKADYEALKQSKSKEE